MNTDIRVLTGRDCTIFADAEGNGQSVTLKAEGYIEATGDATPALEPLSLGDMEIPVTAQRRFTGFAAKDGELPASDDAVLVNYFVAALLIDAGHTGPVYTPGNPVRKEGKTVGVHGIIRWQ